MSGWWHQNRCEAGETFITMYEDHPGPTADGLINCPKCGRIVKLKRRRNQVEALTVPIHLIGPKRKEKQAP